MYEDRSIDQIGPSVRYDPVQEAGQKALERPPALERFEPANITLVHSAGGGNPRLQALVVGDR
jgi:hypothetical protein